MFVHPTRLVLSSVTISNEIFCGSFLVKNHVVICVPTTLATRILFLNHRNRKVVGDKHNVLAHYVDVSATSLLDVVLCNPFKWDILWVIISDQKSCYFCVPAITARCISFRNYKERKVVEDSHNVLVYYLPCYLIWDSAYLVWEHTLHGRGSITNIFAMCAFWAILCLFYYSLPHHTTNNMANVPSIVGVFWPYTYMVGIWVFKPWSNSFLWCCGSLFLKWYTLLGMDL